MSDDQKEFWRWKEYNWHDDTIDPKNAETISAGVDVGSVSSQAVVLVDGKLYAYASMRTGSDSPDSARKAMKGALESTGLTLDDLHYTVGTGYGRVNVPFADRAITEIACHARGGNLMYGPTVRTILDMGGQDCKVIHCDERGKVTNFLTIIAKIQTPLCILTNLIHISAKSITGRYKCIVCNCTSFILIFSFISGY